MGVRHPMITCPADRDVKQKQEIGRKRKHSNVSKRLGNTRDGAYAFHLAWIDPNLLDETCMEIGSFSFDAKPLNFKLASVPCRGTPATTENAQKTGTKEPARSYESERWVSDQRSPEMSSSSGPQPRPSIHDDHYLQGT